MQIKERPQHPNIRHFKVIDGKLLFFLEAHIAVLHARRPLDVIHTGFVLQKGDEAFQTVGDLGGDKLQIDASALLEVGELGNLKAVQHHLPTYAPSPQRGRFPVVFLKLDVMLAEIDANRL